MRRIVGGWLEKQEWIVVVLVVVVILRVPSLFEPYWYGDEGIYLTIGQALRGGESLYRDIHDNKPPLLYWVAAAADGDQFWYRMIGLGWNVVTVAIFANLASKLLGWRGTGRVVAVWTFGLLTTLPVFEGNVVNAELFFLLATVASATMLTSNNLPGWKIVGAGVVLGTGGLFKIPTIVEAGVWPWVWLVTREREWWKRAGWLAVGVGLPLGASLAYYWSQGVGAEYLGAAGLQNVPYLSTWKSGPATGVFTLTGRSVVLLMVFGGTAMLARKLGRKATFFIAWAALTLFAALLSGRPYPHYLLQMAPVLALVVGWAWTREMAPKIVAGGIGVVVAATFLAFRFYVYPVVGYYANFAKWAAGKQNRQEYFGWFGKGVEINYEVAGVVLSGTRPEDNIFVWGDEPMIYALTRRRPVGRYTAKYHILDFRAQKQTIDNLKAVPPKYIVSYGEEETLPGLIEMIRFQYGLVRTVGGAKIFRLWEDLSN